MYALDSLVGIVVNELLEDVDDGDRDHDHLTFLYTLVRCQGVAPKVYTFNTVNDVAAYNS